MIAAPRLGYVQARVQARYAARPGPATWASLAQVQEFGRYLQQADAAGFSRWTEKLGINSSTYAVEVSLREGFRQCVREVADWMPGEWQEATTWFALLVDLEPIRLIVSGEPIPGWIHDDPFLRGLVESREDWPLNILVPVGVDRSSEGDAMTQNWRKQWLALSPNPRDISLARLADLLPVAQHSDEVVEMLERHFRHHSLMPAAVFSYLSLVLLDLYRLKGQLLRRAEFTVRSH